MNFKNESILDGCVEFSFNGKTIRTTRVANVHEIYVDNYFSGTLEYDDADDDESKLMSRVFEHVKRDLFDDAL